MHSSVRIDLSIVDKAINHCLIFMLTLCPCKIGLSSPHHLHPAQRMSNLFTAHLLMCFNCSEARAVWKSATYTTSKVIEENCFFHGKYRLGDPGELPIRPVWFHLIRVRSPQLTHRCVLFGKKNTENCPATRFQWIAQQQRFSIPIANKPFTLFRFRSVAQYAEASRNYWNLLITGSHPTGPANLIRSKPRITIAALRQFFFVHLARCVRCFRSPVAADEYRPHRKAFQKNA